MLYYKDLKKEFKITKDLIECPVEGCNRVPTKDNDKNGYYFCEEHSIGFNSNHFYYDDVENNSVQYEKFDHSLRRLSNFENLNYSDSEEAIILNFMNCFASDCNGFNCFAEFTNDKRKGFSFTINNNISTAIFNILLTRNNSDQQSDEKFSFINMQMIKSFFENEGIKIKENKHKPEVIILRSERNSDFHGHSLYLINFNFQETQTIDFKKFILKLKNDDEEFFNSIFKSDILTADKINCDLIYLWYYGNLVSKNIDNDIQKFNLVNIALDKSFQDFERFKKYIIQDEEKCLSGLCLEDFYKEVLIKLKFDSQKESAKYLNLDKLKNFFEGHVKGYKNGKIERTFMFTDNLKIPEYIPIIKSFEFSEKYHNFEKSFKELKIAENYKLIDASLSYRLGNYNGENDLITVLTMIFEPSSSKYNYEFIICKNNMKADEEIYRFKLENQGFELKKFFSLFTNRIKSISLGHNKPISNFCIFEKLLSS